MKKTIKLIIHSVIDIITNSSTEIYTTCHTRSAQMVKDLINAVLKSAGSDKTADDLLIIKHYQEGYDEDGNECILDGDNVDFEDECIPVHIEITLKENNKDLSDLISGIFESREFAA